ncbi:MAG: AAA family ATPase, partial [Nitrospirota bacterium]|nr:AAA family ATPase [Nitrospirota bacterium]
EDPAESFSFIETIAQAVDGREVFLTSSRTDSNVLLEALRAGAKEFFPQPLQRNDIEVALQKCAKRYEQASQVTPKKVGHIISVMGSKGGVGTTNVAVNLALSLQAASSRRSVVLVEVNQQGGDLAIFLDLQPTHSLRDLGSDPSRLDTALLTRVISKHSSGIRVLPSGYDDLSSGRLSPDFIEPILKLLQSTFDHVVLDCGHVLDLTTKKAIEHAADIVVVSSLIVPVVHRTKRILDLLRASGTDSEKIKVLFNRYAPEEKEVLRETEDALKLKTSLVIPNDYLACSGAINSGTPLVLSVPKSSISRAFSDIVKSLGYGGDEENGNANWVGRLRGLMVGRPKVPQAKASLTFP